MENSTLIVIAVVVIAAAWYYNTYVRHGSVDAGGNGHAPQESIYSPVQPVHDMPKETAFIAPGFRQGHDLKLGKFITPQDDRPRVYSDNSLMPHQNPNVRVSHFARNMYVTGTSSNHRYSDPRELPEAVKNLKFKPNQPMASARLLNYHGTKDWIERTLNRKLDRT